MDLAPLSVSKSGVLIAIGIEQLYDTDGNEVSEESWFKMFLDESLAKSLSNAFGVACEMTRDPYEGWGTFGVKKHDFEHDAVGASYSLDITIDPSGNT